MEFTLSGLLVKHEFFSSFAINDRIDLIISSIDKLITVKLNEILNHHTKNEKFAKQLIAEDLAKDLENLIKQYKEKATKSKTESTDKLKNLIGKISKTIILNLDRGDK